MNEAVTMQGETSGALPLPSPGRCILVGSLTFSRLCLPESILSNRIICWQQMATWQWGRTRSHVWFPRARFKRASRQQPASDCSW